MKILWFLVLVLCLAGCSSQEETSAPSDSLSSKPMTFDIPTLVGKDINGIIAVLGQPQQRDDAQRAAYWGDKSGKFGLHMLFKPDTNLVGQILMDSPSGPTDNKQELLKLGNLNESDPRYKVEFVPSAGNPGKFNGLAVTPVDAIAAAPTPASQPATTHTVTYRVSASVEGRPVESLKIKYRDPSQTEPQFTDVASPWSQNFTFTVQHLKGSEIGTYLYVDVSSVYMAGESFSTITDSRVNISTEILVDNQVVFQGKSGCSGMWPPLQSPIR